MRNALWLSLLLLFMALTFSTGRQAQEKKTPPAAVDLYGDPLPVGAVQRLGTMRFRHDPQTTGLVFSPDGKMLASAGNKIYCCLWDAATGKLLHRLPAASNCIDHMAFSPDSKMLFVGTDLQLFNVVSGKEIRQFEHPKGAVNARLVAFSPDGKTIATSVEFNGIGSIVLFWDVATGKSLHRTIGYTDHLTTLAYSPDGQHVAIGTDKGNLVIVNAQTAKEHRRFSGSNEDIRCIAFSPDSKKLAVGDWSGTVRLWDVATGVVLHKLLGDKKVGRDEVVVVSLAFSSDGKELASVANGKVRYWDSAIGKMNREETIWHGWSVVFSPDLAVLATIPHQFHSTIRLWNIMTGAEIGALASHTAKILSLHFAADGNTLFSVGLDQKVVDWSLGNGYPHGRLHKDSLTESKASWYPSMVRISNIGDLGAVAWFKEEGQLSSADHISIIETKSGNQVLTVKHEGVHFSLSPDSKLLATGTVDGVLLTEVDTGKEFKRIKGLPAWCLSFSEDMQSVAFASFTGPIVVCDVPSGKELQRLNSTTGMLSQPLQLSRKATYLAVVDRQHSIHVWKTAKGNAIAHFDGFYSVECIAFTPSERILAVAGLADEWDENGDWYMVSRIQLWDMLSNQVIRKIDGPQAEVEALAFSPDNRLLASGGADSTILLWDMTDHALPGQLGKYKEPKALTADKLKALWADLASDAPKAEKALWTLAFAPKNSLAFLKDCMQPMPAADGNEVAKLIIALDSQTFAERQKAAEGLEKLGETAEAAVRKHLEGKATLESRQRLQQFLERRDKDVIRKLRAVESVEQIGTPEARELLQTIAKNSPNPRLAEAANAALTRHDNRK